MNRAHYMTDVSPTILSLNEVPWIIRPLYVLHVSLTMFSLNDVFRPLLYIGTQQPRCAPQCCVVMTQARTLRYVRCAPFRLSRRVILKVVHIVKIRESQGDVVYLGWPIEPKFGGWGGGGGLRGLSQWVQLHVHMEPIFNLWLKSSGKEWMMRGYIGQGTENMGRKSKTKCTGTQRYVSAPPCFSTQEVNTFFSRFHDI